MKFGTFPQIGTESRRFAGDRNGVGNERRLSCSLSSFGGTDRDSFEAGNDFFTPQSFLSCSVSQGHSELPVLASYDLSCSAAYWSDTASSAFAAERNVNPASHIAPGSSAESMAIGSGAVPSSVMQLCLWHIPVGRMALTSTMSDVVVKMRMV